MSEIQILIVLNMFIAVVLVVGVLKLYDILIEMLSMRFVFLEKEKKENEKI